MKKYIPAALLALGIAILLVSTASAAPIMFSYAGAVEPQSDPLARSGMTAAVLRPNFIAVCVDETEDRAQQPRNLGNVG